MLPTVLLGYASLLILLALLAFWQSVRALFGRGVDEISAAIGGDRAALIDEKNSLLTALKDIEFERAVGKISDADWKRLDAAYRARAKDVLGELDKDLGPWREKAEKLVRDRLGAPRGGKGAGAPKTARGKKRAAAASASKSSAAAETELEREPLGSEPEHEAEAAEREPLASPVAERESVESDDDADSTESEGAAAPESEGAAAPEAKVKAAASPAKVPCPSCAVLNESDAVFCKKCAARLGKSESEEAS